MSKNFREMPELMKQQAQDGKKDLYIEITEVLVNAGKSLDKSDRLDYLAAVLDTLDNMDFQIYEHYRALQDSYKNVVDEMLADKDETTAGEAFAALVERGCVAKILSREKYQPAAPVEGPEFSVKPGASEVEIKVLRAYGRIAVVQLMVDGLYESEMKYNMYLNGAYYGETNTVITSIYDLTPDTEYELKIASKCGCQMGSVTFKTAYEYVTLNVKDFGAIGDGVHDDTKCIQAAIMSCPKDSRVLVPAGTYSITSIFLKSDLILELAEGAELKAVVDRTAFPQFPQYYTSADGKSEYHLGTWEGNPLPMFTSIICGVCAENVVVCGRGTINGNASKEDWWKNPKQLNIAYRPRLFFINKCKNVDLQGVTCKNSPSWTLHPFFSENLGFYNVTINNPSDSPNTDGLDPESCTNVEIAGVKFSLGDDCIAVKAGKIYMGKKYKLPTSNIHIHHCLMENGHGAVTLGSEMAGGIIDMTVEKCRFFDTDRGLRIKTRRGRGEDAILDKITFKDIEMDHVMTPFVVNCFYFCDPDGKTPYVQSRDLYPVDDRTPQLRKFVFENIKATNCHVAATYFDGLPEKKIEEIVMKNVDISFTENPKCDVPSMSEGVEKCSKKGLFANNIKKLVLENVTVSGQEGEAFLIQNVDEQL